MGSVAQALRSWARSPRLCLLRVKLDDELLLNRHGDVLARGRGLHRPLEARLVEVEPGRDAAAVDCLERLVDADDLAALLLDRDDVAHLHLEGRDVDLPLVDAEVPVADVLAAFGARVAQP